MTPAQTARANELAEVYADNNSMPEDHFNNHRSGLEFGFKAGYSSAVADMEDAAGKEFDSNRAYAYGVENEGLALATKAKLADCVREGARWQHSQDFALIAKLREEIERLKEGK